MAYSRGELIGGFIALAVALGLLVYLLIPHNASGSGTDTPCSHWLNLSVDDAYNIVHKLMDSSGLSFDAETHQITVGCEANPNATVGDVG